MTAVQGASETSTRFLTLSSLPDDLLVNCLAWVSQEDRFRSACLVSKRFHAACLHPQLLRSIEASMRGSPNLVRRMRSLLSFLSTHATHIRILKLEAYFPDGLPLLQHEWSEAETLVGSCLAVCGAAGRLEQLCVPYHTTPLATTAWLPGLTALADLHLSCDNYPTVLPLGASRLTALQHAILDGLPLVIEGLPPNLIELSLVDSATTLPSQMSQLGRLQQLIFRGTQYDRDAMAVLTSLPALNELGVEATQQLPSCLPQLRQLERLVVMSTEAVPDEEDHAVLEAACGQLTRLTCLAVDSRSLQRMPPSITALHRLQRLYMCADRAPPFGMEVEDVAALPPPPPPASFALPSGAWLASLHRLCLPFAAVHASLVALRAAPALHLLCCLLPQQETGAQIGGGAGAGGNAVVGSSNASDAARRAFVDFAASHPPLCRVGLARSQDGGAEVQPPPPLGTAWAEAAAELRRRRPGLIVWTHPEHEYTAWLETLNLHESWLT